MSADKVEQDRVEAKAEALEHNKKELGAEILTDLDALADLKNTEWVRLAVEKTLLVAKISELQLELEDVEEELEALPRF
tara:strand:+ start:80 stop:316 length:237 start_codon:yes stop_codon:yes gene_type:complete